MSQPWTVISIAPVTATVPVVRLRLPRATRRPSEERESATLPFNLAILRTDPGGAGGQGAGLSILGWATGSEAGGGRGSRADWGEAGRGGFGDEVERRS